MALAVPGSVASGDPIGTEPVWDQSLVDMSPEIEGVTENDLLLGFLVVDYSPSKLVREGMRCCGAGRAHLQEGKVSALVCRLFSDQEQKEMS